MCATVVHDYKRVFTLTVTESFVRESLKVLVRHMCEEYSPADFLENFKKTGKARRELFVTSLTLIMLAESLGCHIVGGGES